MDIQTLVLLLVIWALVIIIYKLHKVVQYKDVIIQDNLELAKSSEYLANQLKLESETMKKTLEESIEQFNNLKVELIKYQADSKYFTTVSIMQALLNNATIIDGVTVTREVTDDGLILTL